MIKKNTDLRKIGSQEQNITYVKSRGGLNGALREFALSGLAAVGDEGGTAEGGIPGSLSVADWGVSANVRLRVGQNWNYLNSSFQRYSKWIIY